MVESSLKYIGKDFEKKDTIKLSQRVELAQMSVSQMSQPNESSIMKIKKPQSLNNNSYSARNMKIDNLEEEQEILLLRVEISSIKEENNKLQDIIQSHKKQIEDLEAQNFDLKILNKLYLNETRMLNEKLSKYQNKSDCSHTQPLCSEEKEFDEIHVKDMNSILPKTFSGYFGPRKYKQKDSKTQDSHQALSTKEWNSKDDSFAIDFQNLQIIFTKKKDRDVLDSNGVKIVEQHVINKTMHPIIVLFYEIDCSESKYLFFIYLNSVQKI